MPCSNGSTGPARPRPCSRPPAASRRAHTPHGARPRGVLPAVGKQPVVLEREIDGFIGNRLQFALLREALALWAAGVASAEALDLAVKTSFGRPLAPPG